jgi:hypothetical protein
MPKRGWQRSSVYRELAYIALILMAEYASWSVPTHQDDRDRCQLSPRLYTNTASLIRNPPFLFKMMQEAPETRSVSLGSVLSLLG